MSLDKNYYNRPGLYDKEAIFEINDESVQKCITDTIEEHDIALMLQMDPSYGQRHQETIIKTVAIALFNNDNLRDQIFPEWVLCEDDVMAYLKRNEVQPKLINEYIQLTITAYLQKNKKTNKLFLNNYVANRISKNIGARLAEFTIILRNKDTELNPESIKIKNKLIEDIEWEPALYAYVYDYLLTLPCVNLFKKFIGQAGYTDVRKKLEEMIFEAFEYIEIKRECTNLVRTLESIRDTRKNQDRMLGPTYYNHQPKRVEITSLGAPLGSQENDFSKEPLEENNGRTRVPTLQGIQPPTLPVKIEEKKPEENDSDTELNEDDLFEIPTPDEIKPRAAVIEAGDEDWEEKTKQRGSIKRNGSLLSRSDASGEIGEKVATESAEISVPSLPSITGLADQVITRTVVENPASADEEKVIPDEIVEPVLPQLPAKATEDISSEQPKPALKDRIANIQGTVKNNPLVIVAGTLAAFTSVLATYVLTRPKQQVQEEQTRKKIYIAEKISDARVEEAMKEFVKQDAAVSIDAMIANIPVEVMQADMDFKPVKTVKPVAQKQYSHTHTIIKKVDLSPNQTESENLTAVSLSSIKDLPEGTYKNMFAGESYSVANATEGSITGFMQDVLLEIARKNNNNKEAVKSYYRMLGDLEKGWLLYMQNLYENLKNKANLTEKETRQLEYWNNYRKVHAEKGFDAKFLFNRYKKLKEGTTEYKYYRDLFDKGSKLMRDLEELNPEILDVNSPGSQKVVFAKAGKSGKVYVLKTFLDFAKGMNLPVPKIFTGTTGEIIPAITHKPVQTVASAKTTNAETKNDSMMNLLDRIVNSVEADAAKRERDKSVQQQRTDKFLDKILTQIEENNHKRELDKRNNWVIGNVSNSSSGTITSESKPLINSSINDNLPKVILNDIAPIQKSGTIIASSNITKTQSGLIEKPVKTSGVIKTSESKDLISKKASGIIESHKKPEEKKSFFAGIKDKAKSLWGKVFG